MKQFYSLKVLLQLRILVNIIKQKKSKFNPNQVQIVFEIKVRLDSTLTWIEMLPIYKYKYEIKTNRDPGKVIEIKVLLGPASKCLHRESRRWADDSNFGDTDQTNTGQWWAGRYRLIQIKAIQKLRWIHAAQYRGSEQMPSWLNWVLTWSCTYSTTTCTVFILHCQPQLQWSFSAIDVLSNTLWVQTLTIYVSPTM